MKWSLNFLVNMESLQNSNDKHLNVFITFYRLFWTLICLFLNKVINQCVYLNFEWLFNKGKNKGKNSSGCPKSGCSCLKGLGHVILGNFSTDQMVIELTKI